MATVKITYTIDHTNPHDKYINQSVTADKDPDDETMRDIDRNDQQRKFNMV